MTLEQLRAEIDRIDAEILQLAQARARVVARAWRLKAGAGLPLRDPTRERAILARLVELNRGSGLDPAVIEELFRPLLGTRCRDG
jgi:chorismate mutase